MRPTPETDAYAGTHETRRIRGLTIYEHAKKLERERAEARERAESKHGLWMSELKRVVELDKRIKELSTEH